MKPFRALFLISALSHLSMGVGSAEEEGPKPSVSNIEQSADAIPLKAPEPTTILLTGLGGLALLFALRRR